MTAARDLRGSRRDLAVVLSGGWKTAHEAANELGRPTGSIFGVLRRMHADGLLKADTDPDPPTRGTQYTLTSDGADALRAAQSESVVGRLIEGQRLLVIEYRETLDEPSKILAGPIAAGLVDWGAEVASGWLLALAEQVEHHRVRSLIRELERAG